VYVTTDLPSIQYLTGFTGSSATLGLTAERDVLITDGRYRQQVAAQSPGIEVVIDRDHCGALANDVDEREILVDNRSVTSFIEQLSAAGFAITTVADPVAELRVTKESTELEHLTRACSITARALAHIARTIEIGQREVEIARRLELSFAELGAQDRAFPTIVGSGPNSAIPHHQPGDRRLMAGDLLVIDCGAKVEGYHSDMTRTFIVGAEPEPWQLHIHALVQRAQQAGVQALMPDVPAATVDAAARAVIEEAGYADAFSHGTGHGVGLQIHEAPMLSKVSSASLPQGAVITVEPGIYLPGRGGVRIEDTVVVANPAQVLTEMERGLTRVGIR
jgi:Xaa-Pro dipeptidase